jgi:hypothetical protein
MKTSTSAGLVGAAIISTLAFPLIAARIRRGSGPDELARPAPQPA